MLGVAVALLVAVVGYVVVEWAVGEDGPADPQVEVVTTEQVGEGTWHVEAEVTNGGGQTAEQVEVTASLTIGDEAPLEGTQTIDFLAAGADRSLRFVFPEDPDSGELEVLVTGYSIP